MYNLEKTFVPYEQKNIYRMFCDKVRTGKIKGNKKGTNDQNLTLPLF
jgi:hypothetical protein